MVEKSLLLAFKILAVFAIAIYIWTIYQYAIDMPIGDDYEAVLGFLNQYLQSNWKTKLQLIFSQHNEHRITLTRLASLSDYLIFGKVNFIHLIYIGMSAWFLSLLILWCYSQTYQIRFYQFAPALLFWASFSHFDTMTWAMASIQQYFQILFALVCIGCMVRSHFLPSLLAYSAAIFTGGGGLSLGPLMALYYFSQRQWKYLWVSALFTLGAYWIYFILLSYHHPEVHQFKITLHQLMFWVIYAAGFVGSAVNLSSYSEFSASIAGCILTILFLVSSKQSKKNTPIFFWVEIYILLLACTVAISRSHLGLSSSADSRYSSYSLLFIICLYLQYIFNTSNPLKKKIIIGLGIATSISLFAYWFMASERPLIDRKHWLVNDMQVHPNWDHAKSVREDSKKLGIFNGK